MLMLLWSCCGISMAVAFECLTLRGTLKFVQLLLSTKRGCTYKANPIKAGIAV